MKQHEQADPGVFSGPLWPVFLRYTLPSTLGLLALTTASLVDGFFVGRYVGPEALAAVNLLIPVLTFYFAVVLMIAIGGSVKAGAWLGQGRRDHASKLFSLHLLVAGLLGLTFALAGSLGKTALFSLLGAPASLHAQLELYFGILIYGLPFQFCAVVLYYFLRTAGQPALASCGLISGALGNILLDILFIGVFDFGLAGAAFATVLAQVTQCALLGFYFLRRGPLRFSLHALPFGQLPQTLANGTSEFVNEISIGLVIATINWLVMLSIGVQGVAAFAVINYLQFAFLMFCYGFVDSLHVLVSQNHGAGHDRRARQFLAITLTSIFILSLLTLLLIALAYEHIVLTFLPQTDSRELQISWQLLQAVWPVFIVVGINIAACAFLTATGRALHSAIFTSLRSLLLPVSLLLFLALVLDLENFLVALPLAEWLTFSLICLLLLRRLTSRARQM